MKKTLALLGLSLIAFTFAGCTASSPKKLPPGQYQNNSKSTDSQGTERQDQSSTRVYYDENGNKKATVDTQTSTDPNGLFNKKTTQTHQEVE